MTSTTTDSEQGGPASHHDQPYRRLVIADDLVTDQALADAGGDEFHHSAIAKAVGDLSLSSAAPVNIALFGPWGSGKSTFYNLMRRRVQQQDQHVEVVRYDAWKYGGQALKRNFLQEVARQLDLTDSDFDRDLTLNQEQARIRLGRWFRYNLRSILGAVTVGLIAAALWTAVHAGVDAKWNQPKEKFLDLWPSHVSEFGLVLAAVLTTLLLGPKALESAVVKTTRPAVDRDDQFAKMFRKLINRIKKEKDAHRVVFFIDELDRCEVNDVVATLVDLKTFLDEPDCVFIVAADRDVLEHALRHVPQAKPIREDDPYYSTPGAFIDKIFQHQIALPPLRSHALSSFAHRLVSDRTRGLWRELVDVDPSGRLFNDVVYILVPAHISSPRRVKVLLNNFATSVRIAQSRHIDWVSRARELAFLTVLETEFPTVAAALIKFPDLLAYIRKEKDVDDPAVPQDRKVLVARLSKVAGDIVRDERDDAETNAREERAQEELARQLHDYLGKLAVVTDLHDPRPDLFYLRVVGYDQGLTDPALGEMIDLAAERQPDAVVAAFEAQAPEIRALATELLIQDLAHRRGIGQANVLESACRLVEGLPQDLLVRIAHLAPEVLIHVSDAAWRLNSVPGAVRLAATQGDSAAPVRSLMALLDPGETSHKEVLVASAPALAWADDETAEPIHEKIADFLPHTSEPLEAALSDLPEDEAIGVFQATESALQHQYTEMTPAAALECFDAVTDAALANQTPDPVLWESLLFALNKRVPTITARIHERRDELQAVLSAEHQAAVALYEIEIGDRTNWGDWTRYLGAPEPDQWLSVFARDAAKVIVRDIPTSHESLKPLLDPILDLLEPEHQPIVFEELLGQVPAITWGDASDPDGHRWANLHEVTQRCAPTPDDEEKIHQAVAASLIASVTATLPAAPATPPAALVTDWLKRIEGLPAKQGKAVDAELAQLTPTAPGPTVTLTRLRIAARRAGRLSPLTPNPILPSAGVPEASVMAGEWLASRPKPENALKVLTAIAVGTNPLSRYAEAITTEQRTTLWIALEKDHASEAHLKAVGKAGVYGEAIEHMAPEILTPTQQTQRDKATDRLLTAVFAEAPTRAERERGETLGHRAASQLALALLATDINDNVILAARVIIHSKGCAHGTKTKLRSAFTTFATGKQTRNFTKAQAKALRRMELLAPPKKSKWSWLLDWTD